MNIEEGAVRFAAAFDRCGNLAVAEAGPNAVATFDLHRNGAITALDTAATGQIRDLLDRLRQRHLLRLERRQRHRLGLPRRRRRRTHRAGHHQHRHGHGHRSPSSDGHHLYVQTGAKGIVDPYKINADGSLTATGSVTVGGEGIVAN